MIGKAFSVGSYNREISDMAVFIGEDLFITDHILS
jgi:hypothetical protein